MLSSRGCFILVRGAPVSAGTNSMPLCVTKRRYCALFTAYLRETSATSIRTASPCKNKKVYMSKEGILRRQLDAAAALPHLCTAHVCGLDVPDARQRKSGANTLQNECNSTQKEYNSTAAAAGNTHGSFTPFGLASISARTRARTLSATEAVGWETCGW